MRSVMSDPMTLVLFGATGDLARGKLWPALHDLAASGRLPDELDVLGVSRSTETDEMRKLADEHARDGARLDTTDRWTKLVGRIEAVNGAADEPALYERLKEALDERPGVRLTYLSVAPVAVRRDRGAAGRDRPRARGRDRLPPGGREAVRRGSRERRRAAGRAARALRRGATAEDRPLPRQGGGPEPPGAAVRQRDLRAAVGPPLDRVDPGDGGGGRRRRGPRRVLRRHGRAARRRPEPPAPAARAHADGRADARPGRRAARRAPEGAALAAPDRARRRRARPVRGLRRRGGGQGRLAHRHLRGDARGGGLVALGRRAVLPAHRQAADAPSRPRSRSRSGPRRTSRSRSATAGPGATG